jgi:hypothetical protein
MKTEQQIIEGWNALTAQIEHHASAIETLQQSADELLTAYATQLADEHGVEVGQIYRHIQSGDFWIVNGFQAGIFFPDGDDQDAFLRVQVRMQKVKKWKRIQRFAQPLLQQLVESQTLRAVNPMLQRYEFTGQEMVGGESA